MGDVDDSATAAIEAIEEVLQSTLDALSLSGALPDTVQYTPPPYFLNWQRVAVKPFKTGRKQVPHTNDSSGASDRCSLARHRPNSIHPAPVLSQLAADSGQGTITALGRVGVRMPHVHRGIHGGNGTGRFPGSGIRVFRSRRHAAARSVHSLHF